MMMVVCLTLMRVIVSSTTINTSTVTASAAAQQATAMFVFGDSLVDSGNNNFLNSVAKSNFYPYGVDSTRGASGKFSNGDTFVDYLGTCVLYHACCRHMHCLIIIIIDSF